MAKAGSKSLRSVPEMYDEVKKGISLSLTQTGVEKLDALAKSHGVSRSEFVERIARGVIQIQLEQS